MKQTSNWEIFWKKISNYLSSFVFLVFYVQRHFHNVFIKRELCDAVLID